MCPRPDGEPIDIIVDDREHAPDIVDCLRSIASVTVRIARLKLGDYLADQKLLFERKSLADLSTSIVDGRLFKQMTALKKTKYQSVLILEGSGREADGLSVRREALQGALITVSLILGIPILRSMTPEETGRLIVYAARQIQSIGKTGYARPGYRPKTKKGRQRHILQGLPGVGPERALRLLEKFGSVEAVMCAGREDLTAVEGIGSKTAERIRWSVSEKKETYGDEPKPFLWPL